MAVNIPSVEQLVEQAKDIYKNEFNNKAEMAVFAPGRVNLIGEHTDYNEGFVLPMALPLVTVIVGSKISGNIATIITTNQDVDYPHKVEIDVVKKRIVNEKQPKWAQYSLGVIANYIGSTPAFQAVIISSVPTGGGLSSSAALEVSMYTFLDALNGPPNTVMPTDKALACQKAEHDYAGMPCGIMDQFISTMGKKDNALLIDCRTCTSILIPFINPDTVILITNSNVKHELTGSEYPTRRKQCQAAASLLNKISLRDATYEDIEHLKSLNADEDVIKRARHVVGEIDRTAKAAEALKEKDFKKFGELMVESHVSLKNDFEVSCPELDCLVELALQVQGVLGSRLTGGGFGGCTVTLVESHAVDKVIKNIINNYSKQPTFYICTPSNGTKIL
ncbi:mevalonate kinase/galactokinase [Holotrichia oblita]|uniref:Mevalonate kinase/galactokinase n=1 Tax=Holotrichia oblita TaxID=644536 RepID=A0ACB9SNH6_HOLOL|nr:mevalonate kinase/galactokinase [Holotrichia oblita]